MTKIKKRLNSIIWWTVLIITLGTMVGKLTMTSPQGEPILLPEPTSDKVETEQATVEYDFVLPPKPKPIREQYTTPQWTAEEVTVLAKMLWGEAGGVASDTEKAAVIWCALNHVDAGYGNGSIVAAVTIPGHFVGYSEDNPVDESLKALCEDVLSRYFAEKQGQINVGRVLPQDYLYFSGDGYRNHFRNEYRGGSEWDWSLPSPYES